MCKTQIEKTEQALVYLSINSSYLSDLSLFHGKMGIALFFFELARQAKILFMKIWLVIGKLTIFPNGDVYANPINPRIGNIYSQAIKELIDKELESGASWLRIRNSLLCCNCVY